ncbi:5'-nucleotidase [Streptomyces sp. NPDC089799]|uniref:5'-nucleotidase n=1 Tax=Streptomyces sp. NPDC089799 TaxID=3155066 RepID=UPI00344A83F4
MRHDLSDRLVIGIASSALFDLTDCDAVFREQGEDAYRAYQETHADHVLGKGVAFPFIRRLLSLNDISDPVGPLVEVIVLSRNDPDTGLRVMRSIAAYGLHISRAIFHQGRSAHRFMPALHMSLFLSANGSGVREAVADGMPAGHVLKTERADDDADQELRIAFDFDGIDKAGVMRALDPQVFFDDQVSHLNGTAPATPSVHVPFGVVNTS